MRANPTPDDPSSPAVKYKLSVWLRNGIFPPAFCPHPVNSCVLLQFGLWELFMQQPQDSVVIISGCTFSITPKFMGPTDARDVCVQLIIAEHHWPRYEQQRINEVCCRFKTSPNNSLKWFKTTLFLYFYRYTQRPRSLFPHIYKNWCSNAFHLHNRRLFSVEKLKRRKHCTPPAHHQT